MTLGKHRVRSVCGCLGSMRVTREWRIGIKRKRGLVASTSIGSRGRGKDRVTCPWCHLLSLAVCLETKKKAVDHKKSSKATRRDLTWTRSASLTAVLLLYVTSPAGLNEPAFSMYTAPPWGRHKIGRCLTNIIYKIHVPRPLRGCAWSTSKIRMSDVHATLRYT